ncbi:MAG: hypothetical protein UR28_C0030G0011 [Candidatus Peregrinibacteria bacterium GW2011_GWF2_33_10]|nr:MAG: hypothetical protein UR28_C0030G0011 [Candidatus Peregrinibacteria bacterium GW2011_GWF2_33_10]
MLKKITFLIIFSIIIFNLNACGLTQNSNKQTPAPQNLPTEGPSRDLQQNQ